MRELNKQRNNISALEAFVTIALYKLTFTIPWIDTIAVPAICHLWLTYGTLNSV